MTESLDYRKHNPKVLMGNEAANRMIDKNSEVFGPVLDIFQENGEPTLYAPPTQPQTLDLLSSIAKLIDGVDIRTALRMIQEIEERMQNALFQALSTAHMISHSPEHRKEFDEDTLCEGVNAYLDPERPTASGSTEVTAENVADILSNYFVKPGTKPN